MGFLKKILRVLGTLKKRKILLFSILGGVGIALILLFFFKPKKEEVKPPPPSVRQVVNNLFIHVPEGAYPFGKEFEIRKLDEGEVRELESRLPGLKVMAGEAYEVKPKDGRNEFALKPIRIRIYIPSDYFYGEEFTGVALAYIPEDHPDVYYIYPGSTIGRDDRGYYVEAQAFHASTIAAVQVPAEKQTHSLRLIREVASSVKAAVIIVPGEDPKFSGGLDEDLNFWTSVFPDRTIYVFDYPLSKARSMRYEREAEEFFRSSGVKSYALFEAEILASILKDPLFSRNDYVIIAHGIGGIVARLAVELHPEIRNVKKLVLVSTPSHGTAVANPMYFSSFLFGRTDAVISQNLGVPVDMVPVIRSHVYNYIEKINVFYRDILPNSPVLRKLHPRNDVGYLVIAGTVPPFKIDVSGSDLEKFYPELSKGRGDGVVSVESAKIEGKPLLRFDISFLNSTRADVLDAIRSFVETEKLPKPPEFTTDQYEEFVSPKTRREEEEKPTEEPTKVVEKATPVGFLEPEGFVVKDILRIVAKRDISSYDSGACINDQPYFATAEGLEDWNYVVEKGTFRFLKSVAGELTMVCGRGKCKVNAIGFSRMEGEVDISGVEDVMVMNDGRVYAILPGGGETEKLVVLTDRGYRLVYEAPGVYGRIIPREDGMIFMTNSVLVFLDFDGKVKKAVSMDSIAVKGHRAEAVYAVEKNGMIYVLTRDHYLLVHDEREGKSWIVGDGNIADGFKIVEIGDRYLALVGKRVVFYVDTVDRKIKGCYDVFRDLEIIDAFGCGEDVYLIVKQGEKLQVRIYKPVGLNLPCGNW